MNRKLIVLFSLVLVSLIPPLTTIGSSQPANVSLYGNSYVITPTGIDDTANIQWAFDAASSTGTNSTISLEAGRFRIGQVIARNFEGRFKGAGIASTIIEVIGPQSIPNYTPPDFLPSAGEPEAPGSAGLLIFEGGGNIEVSDLAFTITEPNPALPHRFIHGLDITTMLDYVIYATYRLPGSSNSLEGVWVHNVAINSLYAQTNLSGGINVRIGVALEGANITPEVINVGEVGVVANTPFTGQHRVNGCVIDGPAIGLEAWGFVDGSLIVSQNRFVNNQFGIFFGDPDNSTFDIRSNNVINKDVLGIGAVQFLGRPRVERGAGYLPPLKPTRIRIASNTIQAGGLSDGIVTMSQGFSWGYPQSDFVIEISGNQIFLDNTEYGGIFGWGVQNVAVLNNRVYGNGIAGIYMGVGDDLAQNWILQGNNVQQVNAYIAPIWLGAGTSHTTVIGGSNHTNVLDEGTDNIITGVSVMRGNSPGAAIREAMQRKMANLRQ